jgi:hypothetical protein
VTGTRAAVLAAVACLLILLGYFVVTKHHTSPRESTVSPAPAAPPCTTGDDHGTGASTNLVPTNIYAHNLMLRKGPNFRVYVRWLRGQLARAQRNVNPSFDDPDSFFIDIKAGILRANIGDISNFLNASAMAKSPLKNIALSGDGDQIKMAATLHKVVPLPIEMTGTISATPDDRIQIHVTKLDVLKIPFKGLMRDLHVGISDLFHPSDVTGIQVSGSDIVLDPKTLVPPPRIRGQLTRVRIVNPDLEEVYGNAEDEVGRIEQWRNFLRLRDGTIDFGKLTMHHVDLIMIDISDDAWFDLDLTHYQDQLVNGYTRMTPQAGLQIFMPDLSEIAQKTNKNISIEWLKNRNIPPPPDVFSK